MKRENFKKFINILKIIKNYNIDVGIEDGKIFQTSDSRSCIIDLDIQSLFDEEDYQESIVITNIASKIDLFKILLTMLKDDNDYVRFTKTEDGNYLRLIPSSEDFFMDIRLPSMEQLRGIKTISLDLQDSLSKSKLIAEQAFDYKEFKRIKDLQNKAGASALTFLRYNTTGIIFLSGTSVNMRVGEWKIINDGIKNNRLYKVDALIDFLFPDLNSKIDLLFYKMNHEDEVSKIIIISKSSLDGIDINIYSLYLLSEVNKNDEKMYMKYFDSIKIEKHVNEDIDESSLTDTKENVDFDDSIISDKGNVDFDIENEDSDVSKSSLKEKKSKSSLSKGKSKSALPKDESKSALKKDMSKSALNSDKENADFEEEEDLLGDKIPDADDVFSGVLD